MEDRDEYARGDAEPTRRIDAGVTEPVGGWQPSGEPGQDTEPFAARPQADGATRRHPYVESPPQQPPYIPGSGTERRSPSPASGWEGGPRPSADRNPFAIIAAVLAIALAIVIAFQVGSCTASGQAASKAADASAAQEPTSPKAATSSSDAETSEPSGSSGGETLGSLVGDALDKLGSIDLGDARSQLGDAASQLGEGVRNAAGAAADLLDRIANN